MKAIKFLSVMLLLVAASVCTSSCNKDEEEDVIDYADVLSGVYTGKLSSNNQVIQDAYVVSISKVSSKVVTVSAAFFNEGSENYNVEQEGDQYVFKSESSVNINITVSGKTLTINFLNNDFSMTTFVGEKD